MEQELIKKLNNAEIPEIDMQSHKSKLKIALISSDYFKKPSFWSVFRKPLFLAAPATALLLILAITVVQPKLVEAKAFQIAKNNPEVKKIMEEQNMVLGDVKIKNNKAYILLNPPSDSKTISEDSTSIRIKKTKEIKNEIENAIIEVDIGKKEVTKIDSINSEKFTSLDEEEKDSARNIAGAEEIVSNIIPKEATIEKVSPISQDVHMVEKDNVIGIASDSGNEKKANIQYILDGKKWSVKVNLDKKRIEEIKYSSSDNEDENENKNNKGRYQTETNINNK